MEFIDSEFIISEVGKRPCLYDPQHQEHKNREYRRENWTEVAKKVVDDYEKMDEDTKAKLVLEVQRRWKSIKDSYMKSLKNQETKGGDTLKRRRPYIYHKQMSFLHPFLIEKEFVNSTLLQDDVGSVDSPLVCAIPVDPLAPIPCPSDTDRGSRRPSAKKRKQDPLERELLNVLQAPCQVQDADELFLMSQLPLIKRLTPRDKVDFQIKFLQLLQSYADYTV